MKTKDDFQYRENNFFNNKDVFVFRVQGRVFRSKCHLHNGLFYTNESLNYKCTSVESYKEKDKT